MDIATIQISLQNKQKKKKKKKKKNYGLRDKQINRMQTRNKHDFAIWGAAGAEKSVLKKAHTARHTWSNRK